MKKIFPFLLLIGLAAVAQSFPSGQPYQIFKHVTCNLSGASTVCTPSLATSATKGFFVVGIGYYRLSWTVDGTVSTCSVSIDSNTDNSASWTTGGIASTGTVGSCATQGSYRNTTAAYVNLVRITPAITGSGNVTFTLFGGIFPLQ